jgi:hypothetical protein
MKARTILRPYSVAFLVLLAVLAALWVANRPARAQTVEESVGIDNFSVSPDGNGYVTLDFRSDPTVVEVWANCGGAFPQAGTSQIASQVMARKPDPRVLTLRLFNPTGHPVTASVRINCTFDVRFTVPTTATALREQVAKVVQQAR